MNRVRHQYAAPWRLRFEAGGDVHAVAIDVGSLTDDVPEVDAYAQHHVTVLRQCPVRRGELLLQFYGPRHRVHGASKLDEHPVAHQLDDPPAMRLHCRFENCCPPLLQRRQSARLVCFHQARVVNDIGHHNHGEAAVGGHSGSPALRRPSAHLAISSDRRRGNNSSSLETRSKG